MYEYKVLTLSVKEGEAALNELAKDGWRLVTMTPNIAKGMGVIATVERNSAARLG